MERRGFNEGRGGIAVKECSIAMVVGGGEESTSGGEEEAAMWELPIWENF